MKASGQDIYQPVCHNTPVVSRNMESVRLVWLLLTAVCVCTSYIIDTKSSILSPHETDGVVNELRLPSIKISAKQPFPLNNLDDCNRNAEKGPLNFLLGGLLSSLLSVFSKSHNFHTTEDGNGYGDNCGGNKHINPSEQVSGGEIGNDLSQNDEKTESNGPLIHADIDLLSRDYVENYPNEQTTESDVSIIDADVDVFNKDGEENNSKKQTTESDVSLLDADVDVLNRVGEENNSNEPNTEDNGSLVNADVNVLSKCNGYSTGSGISSTDDDDNNDNDYSTESGSSSVDDLSRNDEENVSNRPINKGSESLDSENGLSKCHGEICRDGYSTESGTSSKDDDNYLRKDENNANGYSTGSSRSSKVDEDGLSKVNEENNYDEQTTESRGPLVDVDADVLTSNEPPLTDTVGGLVKRDVSNDDDDDLNTNLKKIDFNNEYMEDHLDIVNGNPEMGDINRKYLRNDHNVEGETLPFNSFIENSAHQPNRNSKNKNYFPEELTAGRSNMKLSDREFQYLPVISNSYDNQVNNVNIPSEKAYAIKRRVIGYDNDDATERGERSTNSQDKYRRGLPILFRHHLFQWRPVTRMMPLDWKVQDGYLQYFNPEDNIFSQNPVASTRMFPLRIISQAGYPLMAELPQSAVSSNLYGSYASAGMIPANRHGCTGEGIIGDPETSETGSETSVESSETTVERSDTSV